MMRIPVTAMGWGHFAVTGRVTVLEEWGMLKAPPMEAGPGRWAWLHLTSERRVEEGTPRAPPRTAG